MDRRETKVWSALLDLASFVSGDIMGDQIWIKKVCWKCLVVVAALYSYLRRYDMTAFLGYGTTHGFALGISFVACRSLVMLAFPLRTEVVACRSFLGCMPWYFRHPILM